MTPAGAPKTAEGWWWLLAGALIVGLALVFGRQPAADVVVPGNPEEVVARVPSADPEVRALRRAARLAGDEQSALVSAQEAIRLARSRADPRFYGQAQALLAPWLAGPTPSGEALLLHATLLQATHHFDEARTVLQGVATSAQPSPALQTQALLTLAVVELVTGRLASSEALCHRLLPASTEARACLAQVWSVTGRAAEARALLQAELAALAEPERRAWLLSILGEVHQRVGADGPAEEALRDSLRLVASDTYTRLALADLLLDLDRGSEVPGALAGADDDGALLRLAIVERRRGAVGGPSTRGLEERFEAQRLRGDSVHLREQARFALEVRGEAGAALKLAQANWATQKEPSDARLVLAAALAAGRPGAAAEVVDFLVQSRAQEPRLLALVEQVRR